MKVLKYKSRYVLKYKRRYVLKYKSTKVRKKKRANMRFHNRISARFIFFGKSKLALFTFLLFYFFYLYSKLHIVLFLIPLIIHRKEESFFVVIVRTANGRDTIALKAHVGNSEGGIRLITILAVHLD